MLLQTANGNVEAKVVCFYRRRDISSTLIALADKHASESTLSASPTPPHPRKGQGSHLLLQPPLLGGGARECPKCCGPGGLRAVSLWVCFPKK